MAIGDLSVKPDFFFLKHHPAQESYTPAVDPNVK